MEYFSRVTKCCGRDEEAEINRAKAMKLGWGTKVPPIRNLIDF